MFEKNIPKFVRLLSVAVLKLTIVDFSLRCLLCRRLIRASLLTSLPSCIRLAMFYLELE